MLEVTLRHQLGAAFTLDLSLRAGDGVTALFGPSGAGKTTTLNAIAGLLRPDAGRIVLNGRVLLDVARGIFVPPHQRRIGYVFQDARLFPHLSVRRNLVYGAARGTDPGVICDLLGIAPLLERAPATLSGGERQRVAIGRALLSRPDLLLMDEPLAALDAPRKAEILPYLDRLHARAGVPIVYVSHAAAEIARLARTVVLIENGRVRSSGPARAMLSDPASVHAVGLRQAGSVLETRLHKQHDDGLSELAASGGRLLLPRVDALPGAQVRVRILAQDILLATRRPEGLSALNILPCEVKTLRGGDGPGVIVQLQCGSDLLLARITRRSAQALAITPGAAVFAVLKSVSIAPADVGADRIGAQAG